MAGEIVKPLAKAATGDLVTIRGQVYRQVQDPNNPKVKFLEPVEVEAHVNPVSILGGAAAALLGVLFGTVAWQGVSFPGPFGPITLFEGMKDTALGQDITRGYERWALNRRLKAMGATIRESRTDLTHEEIQDALLENIGDVECQLLNREWQAARRRGDMENAAQFLQQAKDKRCPWVKQV